MTNRTIARIFSIICLPMAVPAIYLVASETASNDPILHPYNIVWFALGLYLTAEYTVKAWGAMNDTMLAPLLVWWTTFFYNLTIVAVLLFFLFRDGFPRDMLTGTILFGWVAAATTLSALAVRNILRERPRIPTSSRRVG